jgi:acyl-CoA reductase-like NAD-dependent aldehyde dehydrogenase
VQGVAAEAAKLRIGSGFDPSNDLGPVISDEQLLKILGYVDSARADGAAVVSGGGRHGDVGYFVEPTILTEVAPHVRVAQEEVFGPVVVATPFADLDDLVAAANATRYGLAAGIWTRDVSRVHTLVRRLQAGTIWIKHVLAERGGPPVRRLQGVRLGPRARRGGRSGVHADEVCVHRALARQLGGT